MRWKLKPHAISSCIAQTTEVAIKGRKGNTIVPSLLLANIGCTTSVNKKRAMSSPQPIRSPLQDRRTRR